MKISKSIAYLLLLSFLFTIVIFITLVSADDIEQITTEIQSRFDGATIEHIELFAENKAIAFVITNDGIERELFFEKTPFSWYKKHSGIFNSDRFEGSIHIGFYHSPFSMEEDLYLVLLRVYDDDIDHVQISIEDMVLHDFELLATSASERFGIFITEYYEVFTSEFVSYNLEGEIIEEIKPNK